MKTLKEEHRQRVFENRVLRRISGPKREEVTGGQRSLHNEELHDLYSWPNDQVEDHEIGGACNTNEGEEERV
jgi:hypothetical protein